MKDDQIMENMPRILEIRQEIKKLDERHGVLLQELFSLLGVKDPQQKARKLVDSRATVNALRGLV